MLKTPFFDDLFYEKRPNVVHCPGKKRVLRTKIFSYAAKFLIINVNRARKNGIRADIGTVPFTSSDCTVGAAAVKPRIEYEAVRRV